MKASIAVLGLGRMGSALARAFLQHDYSTTIWNRTESKMSPLIALGARPAASVKAAISAANIIVINVSDYASIEALLTSPDVVDALRGKVLVQLTSGSPKQARDAAAWAYSRQIRYLDGAIMATPDLIGGPQSTILYSGDVSTFEECKVALSALGQNAIHVGTDPGLASALDSAMLVVMWGALFGTLQGIAVCQAEQIPLKPYAEYMKPFLQAMSEWSLDVVQRVEEGRVAGDTDTVASIGTHYGAFRCFMELCRERQLNMTLPSVMESFFRRAMENGQAQHDFAALSQYVR